MGKQMVTEAEYELMKILWRAEEPLALGDILKQLDGKWSRNTVGTMLLRMSEKGVVAYHQKGKSFLYYAVLEESAYRMHETKQLISKRYNGSIGKLVASLYENKEITQEEIEDLRTFINQK